MKIQKQNGQGLIEYLILVALIAVGTMGVMRIVGQSMGHKFASIAKSLGADVKNQPRAPTVSESVWKKKDMRTFMNGSLGRDRGGAHESEGD